MKLYFHYPKSIRLQHIGEIKSLIRKAAVRVKFLFPIDSVDVVILYGYTPLSVTGNSFYDNTIMLIIDRKSAWPLVKRNVQSTFFHEIHHMARIKTVGYGSTLQEAVVTEGLGIAMEEEMGGDISRCGKFKSKQEFLKVLKSFQREKGNRAYNHDEWFFGGEELPKWSGYKLGYTFVKNYCGKVGKQSSQLFNVPAKKVLDGYTTP